MVLLTTLWFCFSVLYLRDRVLIEKEGLVKGVCVWLVVGESVPLLFSFYCFVADTPYH